MSGRDMPRMAENRPVNYDALGAQQTLECWKLGQSIVLFTHFLYSAYVAGWGASPINVIANICAMVTMASVLNPRGGRYETERRLVLFVVADGVCIGLQVASLVCLVVSGDFSQCTTHSEVCRAHIASHLFAASPGAVASCCFLSVSEVLAQCLIVTYAHSIRSAFRILAHLRDISELRFRAWERSVAARESGEGRPRGEGRTTAPRGWACTESSASGATLEFAGGGNRRRGARSSPGENGPSITGGSSNAGVKPEGCTMSSACGVTYVLTGSGGRRRWVIEGPAPETGDSSSYSQGNSSSGQGNNGSSNSSRSPPTGGDKRGSDHGSPSFNDGGDNASRPEDAQHNENGSDGGSDSSSTVSGFVMTPVGSEGSESWDYICSNVP